jgi:hypothetical protein
MDAELGCQVEHVGGLGGCDQEFAGHAAHARAGGAVHAALDQTVRGALRLRGAVGDEAGGAGADHGSDIDDAFQL